MEKRVEEDFPESYGKFMGAKKGTSHIPVVRRNANVLFGGNFSSSDALSRVFTVKESEDKENLPKRAQTGSFKFTFSHSAAAANEKNNDKPAPSASPASPNSSTAKGATVASTPVVKVSHE